MPPVLPLNVGPDLEVECLAVMVLPAPPPVMVVVADPLAVAPLVPPVLLPFATTSFAPDRVAPLVEPVVPAAFADPGLRWPLLPPRLPMETVEEALELSRPPMLLEAL